ncbi:MAG: glycosyltransferase family A protein [Pseudomonadota bacterium]
MQNSTPPVRICLTSISRRMPDLHRVVSSLLAQDYPDFQVHLALSPEPYMLDEGVSVLPSTIDTLRGDPRLQIRFSTNTGPYRKLIGPLAACFGQDVLLATADDDTLYPGDWLVRMVERYQRHHCVIAYRGHQILTETDRYVRYRRWMTAKPQVRTGLALLPTGKDGVLYNARFFHPNVLDVATALHLAPTTDDLWWRWHAAAVGVPVHLINMDYTSDTLPEIASDGSLYDKFNRGGENDRVIERLETYGREKLGFSFLGPVSYQGQLEKRKSSADRSPTLTFAS